MVLEFKTAQITCCENFSLNLQETFLITMKMTFLMKLMYLLIYICSFLLNLIPEIVFLLKLGTTRAIKQCYWQTIFFLNKVIV